MHLIVHFTAYSVLQDLSLFLHRWLSPLLFCVSYHQQALSFHCLPCFPSTNILSNNNFNYPDICWTSSVAKHKQSKRILQGIGGSFLTQVLKDPTRNGVLLNLTLTNWEGLFGDMKAGGSLGCSDHEIVKFNIGWGRSRAASKITAIDFRRDDFSLFGDVLGRLPWKKAPQGSGVQEIWLMCKNHFQPYTRTMHPNK